MRNNNKFYTSILVIGNMIFLQQHNVTFLERTNMKLTWLIPYTVIKKIVSMCNRYRIC